jgi:hypothetical protein
MSEQTVSAVASPFLAMFFLPFAVAPHRGAGQ